MIGVEVEISSAASPDGTLCSAQDTTPLPPRSSSAPAASADRHCKIVGFGAPRQRANRYRRRPAAKKREPAMAKGGSASTTILIARYVEPHSR